MNLLDAMIKRRENMGPYDKVVYGDKSIMEATAKVNSNGVHDVVGVAPYDYRDFIGGNGSANFSKSFGKYVVEENAPVKRFHFTDVSNVDKILNEGLKASVGDGQTFASGEKVPAVFTYLSSEPEPWLYSESLIHHVPLEINLPYEEYVKMERFDRNPNYKEGAYVPNGVQSVERGGYTDIFKGDIPPEYISVHKYPDGYRFDDREIDWEPGKPSIMTGMSGGKVNAAWDLKRNKKAYGTKENFLDEITRQCKDMGFESAAECGAYFLEPTTKKKGLPYIFKSRFIHNKPPIVDSVDPEMLNQWRKKYWNK